MKTIFTLLTLSFVVALLPPAGDAVVHGGESPDKKLKVIIHEVSRDLPVPGEIRSTETNKPVFEFNASGYASTFEGAKTKESTAALWRPDSNAVAVMIRETKRSTKTDLFALREGKFVQVELQNPFPGILKDFGVEEGWRCAFVRPLRWLENGNLVLHVSGDCVIDSGPQEERTKWFEYEITVAPASGEIVESKQTLVRLKNG